MLLPNKLFYENSLVISNDVMSVEDAMGENSLKQVKNNKNNVA